MIIEASNGLSQKLQFAIIEIGTIMFKTSTDINFVNDAKEWKIDPNEIQVSFDVINLYPSVPINEAIPVIINILNDDLEDLKTRTKLTLIDIHQLIELSLSICYFLYEDKIRILPNSGPIGLSLMVVIAEAFLQNIEKRALYIAFVNSFQPITYKRYVDDSHARFDSKEKQELFLKALNEQNPSIKYTVELENKRKQLNFLDICITNTMNGFYEIQIHRKDAITNVQIKPNSNINPSITIGVFKGFLCRAKQICSQKYLSQEIDFLINTFFENGYNKNNLIKITKNYLDGISKNTTSNQFTCFLEVVARSYERVSRREIVIFTQQRQEKEPAEKTEEKEKDEKNYLEQ
ncbi:uncharacterized protein LOC136093215 [Hydra vulgaris]|uniref:uncharacterized protein LOC136093215 n=1 Tax=Hydra vulgaris TaxID=6087 RepID=UPI0032EA6F4D